MTESVMLRPFTLIMIILSLFCVILLYIMVLAYMCYNRINSAKISSDDDYTTAKDSILWIGLLTTFGFCLATFSFFYILYQANKKSGKASPIILNAAMAIILISLTLSIYLSFKSVSSLKILSKSDNIDIEFALLFATQIRTITITMAVVLFVGIVIGNFLSKSVFSKRSIEDKQMEKNAEFEEKVKNLEEKEAKYKAIIEGNKPPPSDLEKSINKMLEDLKDEELSSDQKEKLKKLKIDSNKLKEKAEKARKMREIEKKKNDSVSDIEMEVLKSK